jgi:two-component system phosphate regulon response regulator OmpR
MLANPDSPPSKILVVDDDPRLGELLLRYLRKNGFSVVLVADALAMTRLLVREYVDLIILDWMMPGENGLSACKRLRQAGNRTPIIMLTAKGEQESRIEGLESGADDYLPKPFEPRELLARIHAVLRRNLSVPLSFATRTRLGNLGESICFGPFELDLATRELWQSGQLVPVTSTDFALLAVLSTRPGQPVARSELAFLAHGKKLGAYDRSLDMQISRLRKFIEVDPASPRYLQTVRGVGYVFISHT